MGKHIIRFGVIGCGLMGREFASAAARWCHLLDLNFEPKIIGVCDTDTTATKWFTNHLPGIEIVTQNYKELLECNRIDAIYCAVPHFLHAKLYVDIIRSGKHLLGEKPFGIDQEANKRILKAVHDNPQILVRCSSELPFFPGAYALNTLIQEGRLGTILEVEAGLWHSSDLNPNKPINWKRQIETNGEYGCMGDLGMHVLHIPLRNGWKPRSVRAMLSNIIKERPNQDGKMVPCETWDNAILACDVKLPDQQFPMILSTKRIAPGHANTWFIKISGTKLSVEYSTRHPKQLITLPYKPGGEQATHIVDFPYRSAYKTITDSIFEFGFSDSLLQMWAAFCDEVVNGKNMQQPFHCVTPEETAQSHALFTAALESDKSGSTVILDT